MAGLSDLLQRVARSLEEANQQRPGDDLRAQLGYGTDEDEEDEALESESIWKPRADPEREVADAQEADAQQQETRPTRRVARAPEPKPARAPRAAHAPAPDAGRATAHTRTPAPRAASSPDSVWGSGPSGGTRARMPEAYRAPHSDRASGAGSMSRSAASAQPSPPVPASALSQRIRARLHTQDALREAFVLKELLDRPLARRRRR